MPRPFESIINNASLAVIEKKLRKMRMEASEETNDEFWCVAQLKPNGLKSAKLNLERQGFHSFMPEFKVSKRQENRILQRTEMLFPGYLFVGVQNHGTSWQKIGYTLGVSRVLTGLNGAPEVLPSDFVEQLQLRTDTLGALKSFDDLPKGSNVQIKEGPFTEFIAEVVECKKGERVEVLMSLMGRTVRTNLSKYQLKRV